MVGRKSFQQLAAVGVIALACLATLWTTNVVSAETDGSSQNITMTPSSTQVSVAPGMATAGNFKIFNGGGDNFTIDTSVSPYSVKDIDYTPQFVPYGGGGDASEWVTIETQHTTVKAHDSATIHYQLKVPQGTAPGGYYAVLFAKTSPVTPPTNGVVPHNRVGNVLYVTVEGSVKKSGEVSAAPLAMVTVGNALPFEFTLHNTGGIHYTAQTKVVVKDLTGSKVFDGTAERILLPQTKRRITTEWSSMAPVGIYRVSRQVEMAGKTHTLPDEWIVVVRPLFLVLAIALIVLVVLYIVLRRKMKVSTAKKRD